jgi:hypothetical protein
MRFEEASRNGAGLDAFSMQPLKVAVVIEIAGE